MSRPATSHPNLSHWKEVSLQSYMRDGGRCRLCNSTADLHQHHRTYERFGYERLEDITTVCTKCHKLFHQYRSLRVTTKDKA